MIHRVVMPKLTDTMEEGVVVSWKKQEGDPVVSGDVLAEIETDKAVMDLEAFGSGFLRRILVPEGTTVSSGSLIALIGELDDELEPALSDLSSSNPPPHPVPQEPTSDLQQAGVSQAEQAIHSPKKASQESEAPPKISPRAKALAAERQVDLSMVKGSGPGGRIIERDIPLFQPSEGEAPSGSVFKPLSQMRKSIARTTIQSKAPVPHFYLTMEIAMDEAERLRHQYNQTGNSHLTVTDLCVKTSILALSRHPEVNVSYEQEALKWHSTIDIGIAVALEDGLITPVLRNCAKHTLSRLSTETRNLIERAKSKRLAPEEYTGATFTLSNLGMYDVTQFIAVIMPPQAAALAIGAIRSTPTAVDGNVTIGRRMTVTLSCDHRALDGGQGAQFLNTFKSVLEHPLELFLSPP